MRTNTDYANYKPTENYAIGNVSKNGIENLRIRLSGYVVEILDEYAVNWQMPRNNVIEVLLIYSIKHIAYQKHDKQKGAII